MQPDDVSRRGLSARKENANISLSLSSLRLYSRRDSRTRRIFEAMFVRKTDKIAASDVIIG